MQDDRCNIGDNYQMEAAVKTTDQVQTVKNNADPVSGFVCAGVAECIQWPRIHIRVLRGVLSK
jgi:hypothetical protein